MDLNKILKEASVDLRKRFWKYHQAHPKVWFLFKHYTAEAYASGKRKFSPWAVINRVRWDHEIVSTEGVVWKGDFKVPNEYIACYSRMIMAVLPKYKDFYNTRPMKGDDNTVDWAG